MSTASRGGRSDPADGARPPSTSAAAGPGRQEPDRADPAADALARLYDVDLLEDPGDLDLYVALAGRTGGPILELGVGSGRLAIPLAALGHDVTGVDVDPAMLRRARHRAAVAGRDAQRRLTLIQGDARDGRDILGGPFALAFIALNSLMVFGGRSDQLRAIRTLADHLAPDGLAVVDVWLPDADDLARYDGRLGLEYVRRDPETGHVVTKLASAYHDAATNTVSLTTLFDEGPPGAAPARWTREDRLRLVGSDDLRALAEAAGLTVELIAGGYDLEPLSAGDDRAILVATRPLPGHRSEGMHPTGTVGRSNDRSGLV